MMESTTSSFSFLQSSSDRAEAAAVARAREGDRHAFEQIMRRHNQRLYRLAVSVLGDASEAQDVLQESYVRAFHLLASFSGRAHIGAWLARIVRNEAIDRLRARASRKHAFSLEAELADADEGEPSSLEERALPDSAYSNPETTVATDRLREVLEHAIQSLPAPFRTVFVLREVEGLSIKETAEYLGIPAATVKTRDHRARSLLRAKLDKRIDDATKQAFSFMGEQCDAVVAHVLARIQH
jgi:RNA polymerase sigma-70 factor (ECF subfamily)